MDQITHSGSTSISCIWCSPLAIYAVPSIYKCADCNSEEAFSRTDSEQVSVRTWTWTPRLMLSCSLLTHSQTEPTCTHTHCIVRGTYLLSHHRCIFPKWYEWKRWGVTHTFPKTLLERFGFTAAWYPGFLRPCSHSGEGRAAPPQDLHYFSLTLSSQPGITPKPT